ncbi:MAG TPA: hypothetical protein VFJ74_17030 [Gemmatimonadaceae bacterium]|nr:hypothetical protein [Gemmatimonadaceae bacterium]
MTDVRHDDDPRHVAPPRHPSRREFAAALLAGGAASVIGGAALGACAPAATATVATPPSPSPSAPGVAALAHRADPTTEALFAAVDARYGGRLEADEKAHVRDAIGRTVRLSAALRGHSVANGVDPFSSFCRHAAATTAAGVAAPAVTGGAGKGGA